MNKTTQKKPTFTDIKKKFFTLPQKEQAQTLKDAYNFSPDTKKFWQGRFGEKINDGEEFLEKIKKHYERAMNPNSTIEIKLRDIRTITNNAKKSYVSGWGMLKIYQASYRGILDFCNEFGWFPENLENAAIGYLEQYLKLIKNFINDRSEQDKLITIEKHWIEKHNNLPKDYVCEAFYENTGISVSSSW